VAALLAAGPRSAGPRPAEAREPDSGRRTARREPPARPAPAAAAPTVATDLPPAQIDPHPAPAAAAGAPTTVPPVPSPWLNPDRHAAGPAPTDAAYDSPHVLADGVLADEAIDDDFTDEPAGLERATTRRRLVVYGVPVLALAVVIGLAVWLGSSVLSVAGDVSEVKGSTPSVSVSAPATSSAAPTRPTAGKAVPIVGATVYDPDGDGQPDNVRTVDQSYDGDPATAWQTVTYRTSPSFGNLKPGEGVIYDLGSDQSLAGVTITTTLAGSKVEVRTGNAPEGSLDSFAVAGSATLDGTTKVQFDKAITARYVLVWITELVPSDGGYRANLAEVTIQHAD
jgi:hypothetical protein